MTEHLTSLRPEYYAGPPGTMSRCRVNKDSDNVVSVSVSSHTETSEQYFYV